MSTAYLMALIVFERAFFLVRINKDMVGIALLPIPLHRFGYNEVFAKGRAHVRTYTQLLSDAREIFPLYFSSHAAAAAPGLGAARW